MRISNRLLSIAQFIRRGSSVADIGTDHGLLPIYLVANNIANYVVAGDLNRGPLEAASKNVNAAGVNGSISLRLGSGLDILAPGEIEVCIIAGMGGSTIRQIIADAIDKARLIKQFVLQPMGGSAQLREWLVDNGWRIDDEDLVLEDDRIYEIISTIPGKEDTLDRTAISVGPRLLEKKHPLLWKLIENEIEQNRRIISEMSSSELNETVLKRQKLINRNINLERITECLLNAKQS